MPPPPIPSQQLVKGGVILDYPGLAFSGPSPGRTVFSVHSLVLKTNHFPPPTRPVLHQHSPLLCCKLWHHTRVVAGEHERVWGLPADGCSPGRNCGGRWETKRYISTYCIVSDTRNTPRLNHIQHTPPISYMPVT